MIDVLKALRRSARLKQLRSCGAEGTRLARAAAQFLAVLPRDERLQAIENERRTLLEDEAPLSDGTLGAGGPYDMRTIQVACGASKGERPARLLYFLIREFMPQRALELGTNLGISAAYQAAALTDGTLWTLEASAYRQRLAREVHQ